MARRKNPEADTKDGEEPIAACGDTGKGRRNLAVILPGSPLAELLEYYGPMLRSKAQPPAKTQRPSEQEKN